jgi:hypothetical protein
MKLLYRLNVFVAGMLDFRNPVDPYYADKRDYRTYNSGRNLSNRLTFHFFEWRQQWPT